MTPCEYNDQGAFLPRSEAWVRILDKTSINNLGKSTGFNVTGKMEDLLSSLGMDTSEHST